MPKRQLALARNKISANNAPVVLPTRGHAHAGSTSQSVVTKSSCSTAIVVAAR
jgi:hypothetical protein